MPSTPDLNPFRFSGPLAPEDMIDRDPEADDLLALAQGGHSFRLVGPRRYGKTTLLRRVLAVEEQGMATVLVDLGRSLDRRDRGPARAGLPAAEGSDPPSCR